MRRGSSPVFEYWIMRPRSSEKRISQNGMNVSRCTSSWAAVRRRSVLPGWPETNTASPGWAPSQSKFEVVRRLCRLAAVIGAQDRHVEAPARELEVVRVAAERRDVALGREHEAHVLVAAVLVEPVLAALVERDALALERAALGLLRLLLAGLFHLRERGAPGFDDLVRRDAFERRGDLRRHVLGADQHGYGVFLALQFLLARAGEEAVRIEVVALGGVLDDAFLGAVVVREDQAVARDERARAARLQPHRRLAHPVEPGGVELRPVLLLDRGGGRVVEGPHAFIGGRGQGCERGERRERDELHRELQGMASAARGGEGVMVTGGRRPGTGRNTVRRGRPAVHRAG